MAGRATPPPTNRLAGRATQRELRAELEPFVERPLRSAIRSLGQDLVLLVILVVVVLTAGPPWLVLLGGLGVGLVSTNLFMIGHDAAHGSFTGRPGLNRSIAWLCLTICHHPVGAWSHVHHEVHHQETNDVRGDVVWRPLDLPTYRDRSTFGRWWYRVCRTTPGLGLYYLVEMWSRELMGLGPLRPQPGHLWRGRALIASTLIGVGAGAFVVAGPVAVVSLTVVPLLVLSWFIGFVVYFNHTHPSVPWVTTDEDLDPIRNQVGCTVRLTYPQPLAFFLGNIMEHPAHHVHPGVPLANLDAAQAHLDGLVDGGGVEQLWTPRVHRWVMRTCRLYDFDRHQWLDWSGRPLVATRSGRQEPVSAAAGRSPTR